MRHTQAEHLIRQGTWENFPNEVTLDCVLKDQGKLARNRKESQEEKLSKTGHGPMHRPEGE